MIRFIHTADIHFGMENYGRIDGDTGIHSRLLDFARALDFCIDVAIQEDVDFFLFCGDAYKTAHPTQTQQKLFLERFLRLYQAHIPVVIIVGNHDHPLSFGKAHTLDIFSTLPCDGFYVFDTPAKMVLSTKSGPVSLVGIPWPTRTNISLATRHCAQSAQDITQYIAHAVTAIIQSLAEQLDPSLPAVLAGHLTVNSGIFSGSEKRAVYGTDPLFLTSQLAIAPFDYVALGHLHRYQNLNPHGYPAVVYPGSIERVDFGERHEDKGFCLVTIIKKDHTEHTFITTPMRPFIQYDVMLHTNTPYTQQIIDVLRTRDHADAVIKIVYHIPQAGQNIVDLYAIEKELHNAHYIAGIIPIYQHEQRLARTYDIRPSDSIDTLLYRYFTQKAEFKDKAQELTQKSLDLLCQSEQEANE